MVGIFFENSIQFPFCLINSLLQFLITGKAFNFWGQIEDETMIVHCLESGSIGFEIPFFPLPSRKISWAMEMYNPNVNPYRNDTQIVQNIYKKLAGFSAREISSRSWGLFCLRRELVSAVLWLSAHRISQTVASVPPIVCAVKVVWWRQTEPCST